MAILAIFKMKIVFHCAKKKSSLYFIPVYIYVKFPNVIPLQKSITLAAGLTLFGSGLHARARECRSI